MIEDRKLDFIGIGAPRCGTTWVSTILQNHEKIFIPPDNKELHYFDGWNYDLGLDWYHGFFDSATDSQVIGEFTPRYLGESKALELIKSYNKDIKLIVCLREPVERAISHFKYLNSFTNISKNFGKALNDSNYEIRRRGLYGAQLTKWMHEFDHDQIHIICLRNLKTKYEERVKRLFHFLEVNPKNEIRHTKKKVNASHGIRSRTLFRYARKLKRKVKENHRLFSLFKKFGLNKIGKKINNFNKTNNVSLIIKNRDKKNLREYYKHDVQKLSQLIECDKIDGWGY